MPDHVLLLGERPSDVRPDAQAAYDFARAAADRHLARHLHALTPDELADLVTRQQAILDARPEFDPFELEDARRALDVADRAARLASPSERSEAVSRRAAAASQVAILEAAATTHEAWRQEARSVGGLLRLIAHLAESRDRGLGIVRR